jgi:hypothetical protein
MGTKNINGFKYKTIIVWIDLNVNSPENKIYRDMKQLKEFQNYQFLVFDNINEGINSLKKLRYNPTYIILSGRLFFEFIDTFKSNLNDFYIIPKILIFTGNKNCLKNYDKSNYLNHKFYNSGKVYDSILDLINYFKKDIQSINDLKIPDGNLPFNTNIFELGENKKPFPNITSDDIENLNKYLYVKSKFSSVIERLFIQLIGISEIPIQLLIKYYLQAFNVNNQIFKSFNNEKNYYTFIKVFKDAISNNYISNDISNLNDSIYCSLLLNDSEIESLIKYKSNNENKIHSIKLLTFISSINLSNKFLNESIIPLNNSPVLLELDTNDLNNNKNFINIPFNENNKIKHFLFLPLTEFFIANIETKIENQIKKYNIKLKLKNNINSNEKKNNENNNNQNDDFTFEDEESTYALLESNFIECFLCPISGAIMKDPVITKYGHSYERNEIEKWIEKSGNDPMTKKPLTKNDIFPNFQLKSLIEEYKKMKKFKKNPNNK